VPDTEDHHYIPQFFLKAWGDARGAVTVYSRRNGRIVTSSRRDNRRFVLSGVS